MSDDAAPTRILSDGPAGELPVGATLSQGMYRITGRIAAGGFGITYEARDNLDRKVAIKECFPAGLALRSGDFTVSAASASTAEPFETARTLFLREARTLAALRHPNVVHVQTLFEENGTAYMAMDYVEGRDLQHVIAHEPELLTPAYIMELTRALLAALDYLHRDAPANDFGQGKEPLLHRDIKPANIRIDPLNTPVVIDFGAARQETKAQSRAAGTFRVVSDGYSPNEFYVAGTEQGPASDLYSLAATLHHCISGAAPAPADERAQKVSNGEEDPYQPISGRFPAHDPRLLALIDRALARPLRDRPADAAAWRATIPDATTRIITPVATEPDATPTPAPVNSGVWKRALIAGVSALALGGVGVYALTGQTVPDPELRRQLNAAIAERETASGAQERLEAQIAALQEDLDAARAGTGAPADMDLVRASRAAAEAARDAARAEAENLSTEVAALEAQLAALGSGAPDTATLVALEAERTAALAAQEAAERASARARADLQRMAADLAEAEAEAARLRLDLRTARAELNLLLADDAPATNPDPDAAPAPDAACPDPSAPGAPLQIAGADIYNPQTLITGAGGNTDLADCAGLPVNATGLVDTAPTYTLTLSEMSRFRRVELQVVSVCDTILLVNTQDGAWHFDDNSNGGILPLLNLTGQEAIEGQVGIWIGTADGSSCTADLELETWLN